LTKCKVYLTNSKECVTFERNILKVMKTNLRKYRFENGEMSQQDLAEKVGVSRQTIVSIEKGDYNPSVKLALLLAKILNATVEQLFELEEEIKNDKK